MSRLYTSTSFRPIIDERLDPVFDPKKEFMVVGRTKKEQRREGSDGLLDIGVVCEKQASGQPFHGYRVYMDAKFPHIVFICGKRGGGKSYTLGVIAEELCRTKIGIGTVIVDPIGIYWSMKKANQSKKEIEELGRWDLKPAGMENICILGPLGIYEQGSDALDGPFSIKPSELSSEEWCLVFDLDRFKIQGLLIGEALEKVREGYRVRKGPNEVEFIPGKGNDYEIEDIIDVMDRDVDLSSDERGYARTTRRSVIARLKAAERWGIFSREGTPIEEVSVWDRVTVIDVSHPRLENQIRALIVGILAKKILQARMESSRSEELGLAGETTRIPVTWLLIDEAHLLIPRRGLTAASKPLIEYAKLGRKPGCALALATQRPAATDDDILSQVDILLGHSLGLEDDIAALLRRVPAKLPAQIADSDFIRGIPSGFAIMADQKTQQRGFLIQIRPRLTHHSGKEATPAKQVQPSQAARTAVAGSAVAPGIESIWEVAQPGPGSSPAAKAEEEFEIVSAGTEAAATPGVSLGAIAEEEGSEPPREAGGSEKDIETVPKLVLGIEGLFGDKAYADEVVVRSEASEPWQGLGALETDLESVEELPEELPEEPSAGGGAYDGVSLSSLSEMAAEDFEKQEPEVPARGLGPGPDRLDIEAFPVVLRLDSAKGLAIERMRTGWTGRPKEFIESVELIDLPMVEVTMTATRKGRLTGESFVRCRLLFDSNRREMITDFRDFKRSKGLSKISELGDRHLRVIACLSQGRIPEECEDLGMKGERIREIMRELADRGIIVATEDKKGRMRGSISSEIRIPDKPESVRGDLPSHGPARLTHSLDSRIDERSLKALLKSVYPQYEVESLQQVHMPYYEITYASEKGTRKEHVNAFTGLFEDLGVR